MLNSSYIGSLYSTCSLVYTLSLGCYGIRLDISSGALLKKFTVNFTKSLAAFCRPYCNSNYWRFDRSSFYDVFCTFALHFITVKHLTVFFRTKI